MKIKLLNIVLYVIAAILLYPIVAYTFMYELNILREKLPHGEWWLLIQIFISGPGLLIIGLILYRSYGQYVMNKIFGVLFFLISLFWIVKIILTIKGEAA